MQKKQMTLLQHFSELRKRIIYIFIFYIISFFISWIFSDYFIQFFTVPFIKIMPNTPLVYNNITDSFFIKFSISGFISILSTIPFCLWHLWKYISPGLYVNEKKFILPVIILSPILFLTGSIFAFYFLYPLIFKFFISLNNSNNLFLPNINKYLDFSISMIKVFGIVFQMPLILYLLNRVGILSKLSIISFRRYAYVIVFIVAALLTPPDIISQFMLAIPMIILFEISILFMK